MNKNLGEKFYKKKAFIESTDGFVAVVQGKPEMTRIVSDLGESVDLPPRSDPTTSERLTTHKFTYFAVVVIDSGKRAKIDQDDLETVIPSAGRQVVILVGEKRGHIGELVKVRLINSFHFLT